MAGGVGEISRREHRLITSFRKAVWNQLLIKASCIRCSSQVTWGKFSWERMRALISPAGYAVPFPGFHVPGASRQLGVKNTARKRGLSYCDRPRNKPQFAAGETGSRGWGPWPRCVCRGRFSVRISNERLCLPFRLGASCLGGHGEVRTFSLCKFSPG